MYLIPKWAKVTFAGLIILLPVLQACKKEDQLYSVGNQNGPKISDLIHFLSLSADSLYADSASREIITVQVTPEADSLNKFVIFSTLNGTFPNGFPADTIHADANGVASTSFLSATPNSANIVTATVKGISIDTIIRIIPALPDDMSITADKYLTDTLNNISINASLVRNPGRGKVSDPVKVYFTVTPDSVSKTLIINSFSYSANGIATALIQNPFKYTGSFIITAETVSATGDSLKRMLTVRIK